MTPSESSIPGPPIPPSPTRARRGGWLRWVLVPVLAVAVSVVVLLLALQNPWFATRFVNAALRRIPALARAEMRVVHVRGNWIAHLELTGFRLTRGDTLLVSADTVLVHYRIASLIGGRLDARDMVLDGVTVTSDLIDTTRAAPTPKRETLTLADLLHGRFYPGPSFAVDRLVVRRARYGGRFGEPDSTQILTDLDLMARDIRLGGVFSFQIDSLIARRHPVRGAGGIDLTVEAAVGQGRFEARTLHLRTDSSTVDGSILLGVGPGDTLTEGRILLRSDRFALSDLRTLMPGLALEGVVRVNADLRGPRADRLSGPLAITSDHARWGDLRFDDLDLSAPFVDGRSDLRLSTRFQDADTRVTGWIRPLDPAPSYDLAVHAERLPGDIPGVPGWETLAERAQAGVDLRIQGTGYARPVAVVSGRVAGEAGTVDLDGRIDLTNGFAWEARRVEIDRLDLARMIGDTTASSVSGTLRGSGRSGGSSPVRVAAALTLAPSRFGAWEVDEGDARVSMNGTDLGGALRLVTEAGTIEIDSVAGRWDRAGVFRVRGARFTDLDLARLTGNAALSSRLDGTLAARMRGVTSLGGPGGAFAALRNGRASGESQVALAPSMFRGQPIDRGSVRVTLADGQARVDGQVATRSGTLELAAHARPFDEALSWNLEYSRFTDVDLSAWTGSASLRSRLSGQLQGQGRMPRAPGAGATWEGALRLDRSRIGGADFAGTAHGAWSEHRAHVTADLRTGIDTVSARLEITPGERTPSGTFEALVPLRLIAVMAGRESLTTRGSIRAQASFTGVTPATAMVEGHVTGSGVLGRARFDSLYTGFHLRDGTLTLDTLLARSNVFATAGSGRMALFDSTAASDFSARLRIQDAAPLAELLGVDTLSVDTTTVEVRLHGAGGRRTFGVRGSLRSLVWNDVRLLGADGTVQGEFDASWRMVRMRADASLRRLHGIGLSILEATGNLELDGPVAAFDVTAIRDQTHRLHVTGRSEADSAGRSIELARVDAQTDSMKWTLARPARIDLGRDRFAVDHFELRSATGRLDAHGVIDRRGEQNFGLDLANVQIDILSTLLGRENLTGTLNGNLRLAGPAAAPRGNGRIEARLDVDGNPAGTVSSTGAWDGRRLDIGGRFATPEGDSLAWSGKLPLALSLAVADTGARSRVKVVEGDVDVRLSAHRFPLSAFSAVLDPRTVGPMAGTLDLDLGLRGTSRSVTGNGRIDVAGGVVPLPGLGVIYRDIDVQGAFQNDRLVVSRTHAASNKGTIDASGDIRFIGVTRIEPRLRVDMKKFVFVDTQDLRAVASGGVDITGSVTSPVVKGKVTIGNSNFYILQSDLEAASTVQLTPADLRMLEENFGDVQTTTPNAALEFYDASELDLAVTLERDNWVRQRVRPKMSVALTGNFQLKKAPHGEPQLFGRVAPIPGRGYVEQFARSFDITGGEVLLNGPMTSHQVDIQAQYKPSSHSDSDESETVVNLDVDGTINKLSLVLSSEPAMSEVEIIDFIATGKTKNDPASASSDANLAKDIGMSQVTGLAEERAQEAIGLDVLQVRFDALQGATLVAGRFLDPQLYVGFRQPLQYKDTGSTTNSNVTNQTSVEVEYAIHQWLVLNMQAETAKVRSFIRVRHAY